MDPECRAVLQAVSELSRVVRELVVKVDGLVCHYTCIDSDYGRVKNTLRHHDQRIERLERDHNIEPTDKLGTDSALFPSIKKPS